MILRLLAILSLALTLLLYPGGSSADADFWDVRTNLQKDRSGKGGDKPEKYFHESTFHPHYDGRFADREIPATVRLPHLTALMQTYLATMSDIGVETWIMHGTLLGWWWNQKILPWDSDLDVSISEPTIHFLAKYYNMTEFHYDLPGVAEGRTYLLEINPHFTNRSTTDTLNVIDARWIDTETGLFIDISTVRKNITAIEEGIEGALLVKDKHHYVENDLFPLRDSLFEGIHVKIPFDYVYLLEEEYGKESLTRTTFSNHRWNATSKVWEPMQRRIKGKRPPRPGGS